MSAGVSAREEGCLLVVRCTGEPGAPETLRIRAAYYPEIGGPVGEVRTYAAVDEALAGIGELLRGFPQRVWPGTPRAGLL